MKYTFTLLTVLLLAPLAALHAAQPSKPEARSRSQPNIVFILADDWGWGDWSCHGHSWLETPNIDRLAHERAACEVANAVCSKSDCERQAAGRYSFGTGS